MAQHARPTSPTASPGSSSSSSFQEVPHMMRVVYFSNEFPSDDLESLLRCLDLLSKDENHRALARFLDEATKVVLEEVCLLTTELKKLVPAFESIVSLASDSKVRKSRLQSSIDGVLHCFLQLGTYIAHCEFGNRPDSAKFVDTVFTGLGLGMLSTAAVALSPTVQELPIVAAEAVRIAFRLGVHVTAVSQNLEVEGDEGSVESWAHVINGCSADDAQQELDSIQAREPTPQTAKVFISAVSQTSVTISGPPSRLKSLFHTSGFFRDRTHLALPVYGGLCHAKHIYTRQDVLRVVSPAQLNDCFRQRYPVLSTSTGKPFPSDNASGLLEQVVHEIMTRQIIWDNVVKGVVRIAVGNAATRFQVTCFRASLPVNDLCASLESKVEKSTMDTQDLIGWLTAQGERTRTPRTSSQSRLAVVGMSCRLPGGATDNERFWEILQRGLDVSREIPADRFDVATHYDPNGKDLNKTSTKYGCFIDEPGLFDAPFFNMSPKESQTVDPQMRLALVTAYEALEQSGYVGGRTPASKPERIGTYYGQAADDYREVNQGQEVSTYYIPGGCRAFGPGRINYFFKFSGPSYSIDTACSSGLAAVEVACQALWSGTVDTVVTGGLNVLTNPDGFAGLCSGHFLTKGHNACKTWDATADGYCRADGIVSFVIKRLEDADADNDRILGLILGASTNHSAEAISITHPHAGHQAYLARQVLYQAALDPLDVSYIELHGTGTQAGDFEEMKAVTEVYAPLTKRRSKNQPLHIGSVKANFGHGESVAGATSLLKVLLMFEKNAIPPHIGIKTEINPRFSQDFDKRNLHIPLEYTAWLRALDRKRFAVVNSFGAAGGNTAMVLEEATAHVVQEHDPRKTHVVAVSAKGKISLKGNMERLVGYLDKHPDVSLADLSYTTTARRHHHNYRVAIVTSSVGHLKQQLTLRLVDVEATKPVSASEGLSVAMVFTGQGASDRSMNLELYHRSPVFRSELHNLDSLTQRQGFPSFISAVDGTYPKDHVHPPSVTQVSLVCIEIALAKYWGTLGIKPDVVLGHSLGEYAALYVAGVLSASDAIFLTASRAVLLEERCSAGTHNMMAVEASITDIKSSSNGLPYEIACINGPNKTVIAGTVAEVKAVAQPLQARGYRCVLLETAFAFHSAQTDPVLSKYLEIAKTGAVFHAPNLPVISPLLSRVIFDDKTVNAEYVMRATREPVNFLGAIQRAYEMSIIDENTAWVEVGPHPVCLSFVNASMPLSSPVRVPSFRRGEDNWSTIAQSLGDLYVAGAQLNWSEYQNPFEKNLRLLSLPAYAWNDKTYWLPYTGDWALTKGNSFYTTTKGLIHASSSEHSNLKTSTIHEIIEESYDCATGKIVVQADLMQPDFLAAAHGHSMNGYGVVTSSIHADVAFTLGQYLYKKLLPTREVVGMNVVNLEVAKGLVARSNTKTPQLIQVVAETVDIDNAPVSLQWFNVGNDKVVQDRFATASIVYGDPAHWLRSWAPIRHLIQARIDELDHMARDGRANRLTHSMAYRLFANLVDYAEKYRGMQTIVLHEYEAYADIELSEAASGIWTVPPYFIDSVAHLAGFIMNGSDASDTANTFCVTPGWSSMRFATALQPGDKYRSYVKMIPTSEDPNIYFGDVYIMQDGIIMGMVGGMQFRRYPRILLTRFFSPSDKSPRAPVDGTAASQSVTQGQRATTNATPSIAPALTSRPEAKTSTPAPVSEEAGVDPDSTAAKAMDLIASEVGIDLSELQDDNSFANMGVDSLMSLVLSEKFRRVLDISVSSSLFLEYPTVGDLREWLVEYHS